MPFADERMPDTAGANLYREDRNLQFVLTRYLAADQLAGAERALDDLGRAAGGELDRLAAAADRNPPVLHRLDRQGRHVDEVAYHPAYQQMERLAFERYALAASSHRGGLLGFEEPIGHVLKYALTYVFAQAEFGVLCPVNMTDSLTRVLRRYGSPGLNAAFLPLLTATDTGRLWQGAMLLTERSGGSDVGALETVARPAGSQALPNGLVADAPIWRLTGSKWFCSNVDAELALVLARPEGAGPGTGGLGLFLVPRYLPDGSLNACRIERLKDKFGTRDMATGEVTLEGALGYQVGELDRGFVQMAAMINASRLSNAVRSAGMMRRAYFESFSHASASRAFGTRLIELPLQQRVLMQMLVEVEGAVAAIFETASTLQRAYSGEDKAERLARILTPLMKAVVTRRARHAASEAMEARGGNGYVEEWVNPRLVRDTHLGSIWEGTTNVVQLDVLRAMIRTEAHRVLFAHIGEVTARLVERDDTRPIRGLATFLEASRQHLEARCTAVLESPRPRQEAAMHRLAPALFDLFAGVCLADEASFQLTSQGSARKLIVASLHAALRLGPAMPDPLEDPEILALIEPLERWVWMPPDGVPDLGEARLAPT